MMFFECSDQQGPSHVLGLGVQDMNLDSEHMRPTSYQKRLRTNRTSKWVSAVAESLADSVHRM